MAKRRFTNPFIGGVHGGLRGGGTWLEPGTDINEPYDFEREDPASFGSHNTRGYIGTRTPDDPVKQLEAIQLRDQIRRERAQFPLEQRERQIKSMTDLYGLQHEREMSPLQMQYLQSQIEHERGGTEQEAATTRLRGVEAEEYGPTHQKHQNALEQLQVLSALFGGVDKLPHGMKDHFLKQFSFNPDDFKEEVPAGVGGTTAPGQNKTSTAFAPNYTPARDLMMEPLPGFTVGPTPPNTALPTPFEVPKTTTQKKQKKSPNEELSALYPPHPMPPGY